MTALRTWHAAGLAAALLLTLPAHAQQAADNPQPAAAQTNKTLVTVNGTAITQADVEFAKQLVGQSLGQIPANQHMQLLTNLLIEIQLLAEAGEKAGVGNSETFKRQFNWMRLRALRDAFVEAQINSKISDADVKASYDEIAGELDKQLEVRARHILLKTEDEAKAVIAELDGGADFAELAKTKSTGPSASRGGDLGFFGRGRMVPSFDKAAFEMKPGTYSKEPVKSQFGWHVIKIEESRARKMPPFDQVKDRVKTRLQTQKLDALLSDLRGKADIKYEQPQQQQQQQQ